MTSTVAAVGAVTTTTCVAATVSCAAAAAAAAATAATCAAAVTTAATTAAAAAAPQHHHVLLVLPHPHPSEGFAHEARSLPAFRLIPVCRMLQWHLDSERFRQHDHISDQPMSQEEALHESGK